MSSILGSTSVSWPGIGTRALSAVTRTYWPGTIARLAFCEEQIAALESLVASGENAKDELAQARTDLAQLTEAAEIASAKRERAELEAAELNLRRQQKLLKLGVARESDVTRAEEKLAELRSQKN